MTSETTIKDALFEDAVGMAGSQLLAFVVSGIAGVAWGCAHAGAVDSNGAPLQLPFGGAISLLLLAVAPVMSVIPIGRYRPYWREANQSGWISARLIQMLLTAVAIGVACFIAAGAAVDLWSSKQHMVQWLLYGLIICGMVQAAAASLAFVLHKLGVDIPDALDG